MKRLARFTPVLAAAVAVSCAIAAPARAVTPEGTFAVRGIGAQTCARLNEALSGGQAAAARASMAAWTAGWLSHANRSTENTFDLHPVLNNGDIAELLARLCRSNPDAIIETVLSSSTASLQSGAAEVASDPVEIESDGRRVVLREAVLRKTQDTLVAAGLLEPRMADGAYGPATAEALRKFQADRGIPFSGLPDMVTLYLLFIDG